MNIVHYQGQADGPSYTPGPDAERRTREPLFNRGAWPVLALVGAIVGGYALQSLADVNRVADAFAFRPDALATGRWWTLFSSQFLHGGWAHALMNAAFILAFGTPVARYLGLGLMGALLFYGFYLVSGAPGGPGLRRAPSRRERRPDRGVGRGLRPDGRVRPADRRRGAARPGVLPSRARHGRGLADREPRAGGGGLGPGPRIGRRGRRLGGAPGRLRRRRPAVRPRGLARASGLSGRFHARVH
ncbi:rhomboid family intramembrane serine protease [Phenylobacterium sp. J367]|nr:rhomboid family intramembrane serine protease [Phenylobacterium sp. J367]MCR5879344.1 rhomboid family intramembrane serine protease [Phenylobacterium sp. J367]